VDQITARAVIRQLHIACVLFVLFIHFVLVVSNVVGLE